MSYFKHGIEVDTHVHSMLSGHSWSSLQECAQQAAKIGLRALCLTEHSSAAPNGPPDFVPHSMGMIPESLEGVRVYHGIEADIMSTEGELRPPDKFLKMLEFVIASAHTFTPAHDLDADELTRAYFKALANPYVCILGHIDTPGFDCDLEAVVKEAGRLDKLIELNNSALDPKRHKDPAIYRRIMELCKKHGVRVCVSSDAHFHTLIGDLGSTLALMEEVRFPIELILNYSYNVFDDFIEKRRTRLGIDYDAV